MCQTRAFALHKTVFLGGRLAIEDARRYCLIAGEGCIKGWKAIKAAHWNGFDYGFFMPLSSDPLLEVPQGQVSHNFRDAF